MSPHRRHLATTNRRRRSVNKTELDIVSMMAASNLDDSDVFEVTPTEPAAQPVARVNITCDCGHRTTVPRVLAFEGANCPRCRQPLKLPDQVSTQPTQSTTIQRVPSPSQSAGKLTLNCGCGHRFTVPRALAAESMACPRCRKRVVLPEQVATNVQQVASPTPTNQPVTPAVAPPATMPVLSQRPDPVSTPVTPTVHQQAMTPLPVPHPVMQQPAPQQSVYNQPIAQVGYQPTPGLPLTGSSAQFVVPHANATVMHQSATQQPQRQISEQTDEVSPTEAPPESTAQKAERKRKEACTKKEMANKEAAEQGKAKEAIQEPLKLEHKLPQKPRLSKDEYSKHLKEEMSAALKTKSSLKFAAQEKPILPKGKFKKLSDTIAKRPTEPTEASVQADALRVLAKSGDHLGLDLLLQHVTSPWDSVREALASSLGYVAHPDAADGLIKLLDDASVSIRRAAIDSLVKLKDPRCVRPLLTLAFVEPGLRFQILKSLNEMKDSIVDALIGITREKDSEMTVQAIAVLAAIGKDKAIRRLVNLLGHPEANVRAETASGLAKVQDHRTAAPLARCLEDHEKFVRIEVTAALAKLPNAKNLNSLLKTLSDEEPIVRANSASALGAIKHNQSLPALLRQLDDEIPQVRYAVIDAIGLIGDKQSVPKLLELLDAEDVNTRTRTIIALRNHGDPRAVPHLENLLGDRESIIRRRAVEALGKCGDAKVADKLGKVLTLDRLSELRSAAARSLGEIGHPTSVPFLEEALRDEVAVRCHAVSSLGAIADESCLPALLAMLKDSAPEVRYQAASALCKLNDPNSIEPLCNALDDEKDEMVVRGIKKTLEDMGATKVYEKHSKSNEKKKISSSGTSISQGAIKIGAGVTGVVAVIALCVVFLFSGGKSNAASGYVRRGGVSGISFSPDGNKLGVGHSFGTFELWEIGSNKLISQLPGTCGSQPLFSENGDEVFFRKGTVISGLNIDTEQVKWNDVPNRKGHLKAIVSELMNAQRDVLVTVALDRNVKTWDMNGGGPGGGCDVRLIGGMTTVGISPDGETLLFGTDKGHVEAHALSDGSLTTKFEGFRGNIQSVAYSADGTLAAAGNQAGGVAVWKVDDPTNPVIFDTQAVKVRRVSVVAFHPTKPLLAVGEFTGNVHFWDLQSREHRRVNGFESDRINHLAFSPDGHKLAFGGDEAEEVFLYDFRADKIAVLDVAP